MKTGPKPFRISEYSFLDKNYTFNEITQLAKSKLTSRAKISFKCKECGKIETIALDRFLKYNDVLAPELGVHTDLIHKTPIDGLQPLSDEEKLGFTYHEVHELIREGKRGPHHEQIKKMYFANKFKTDIIQIPAYEPRLPNYITNTNIELL